MRVKEWVDGTLILDGDIDQGVEEPFHEGWCIEAFTCYKLKLIGGWLTSTNCAL